LTEKNHTYIQLYIVGIKEEFLVATFQLRF
jgi:hypothetical protein